MAAVIMLLIDHEVLTRLSVRLGALIPLSMLGVSDFPVIDAKWPPHGEESFGPRSATCFNLAPRHATSRAECPNRAVVKAPMWS